MSLSSLVKATATKLVGEHHVNSLRSWVYSLQARGSLARLAILCQTDKEVSHSYSQHYQRHFEPLRRKKMNVLEIGVGGYDEPEGGGASLRMWKSYFPKSSIYGLDIYDKSFHDTKRIKTLKGSQVDETFMKNVADSIGQLDIIIDDGSHFNEHVITTFKMMFPLLAPNGIYVIEDLQTSYWTDVNGTKWDGAKDLDAKNTSMSFLKRLVDGLNYDEFTIDDFEPTYFDRNITGIHFYHNLAFIYKGKNEEGSNMLGNRFQSSDSSAE